MKGIRRHIVYSILPGFFLGNLMYFGAKFLFIFFDDKPLKYSTLDLAIPLIFSIIASIIFYFLLDIKLKIKSDKNFNLKRWQIFLPLALVSIIFLLAVFPGHYPYDSSLMYQEFESGNFSNHYAPTATFLLGVFLSVGKAFGSIELGHAALIIIQILFINFALTETIFYCSKKLNKKLFAILFVAFFVFHPLVQTIIVRSGQDTFFGGIFLLLSLELLKISEDKNYFKSKKKIILFSTLIFLLCIFRNNGFYTLIPLLFSSFFILKDKNIRKRFLLALTTPIVIFFGYNSILSNTIIKTHDSFFRETLNMPIMQIARAMYYNPDESFKNELKTYFNDNCKTWMNNKFDWKIYERAAGISDPFKDCLNTNEIEKDPLKFFDLWRRIGEKNPERFAEAPFIFTLGLYHPFLKYEPLRSSFQAHRYIDSYYTNYTHYGINNSSMIPWFKDALFELIGHEKWSNIPVVNFFWRIPFTTFLCFFLVILAFYRKKHEFLLPLLLFFGLFLTVALSPVMLFRYVFPAVLATPILIYVILKIWKTT